MSEPRSEFVEYRGRRVLRSIARAEVTHLVAEDKYVTVHAGAAQALIADSLAALVREGMPEFVQVHRAHLVRVELIASVGRDGPTFWVNLVDGQRLPMSRRLRAELFKVRPDLRAKP